MKLYNLYQEVIFEEAQKQLNLISEAISDEEVKAAIQGKYNVRIYYRDKDDGTPPSKRYVQIYTLGVSKAGNPMIRAYQINGFTNHPHIKNAWKTFRLDRIESIEPTKMPWYNPMSDYNASAPDYVNAGDKEFSSIIMQVDPDTFDRGRMLKNLATKQNKERQKQQGKPEPVYNRPEPEPKVEPTRPAKATPTPAQAPARPNLNKQNKPNLDSDKEEELEKDIYGNTNPAIR